MLLAFGGGDMCACLFMSSGYSWPIRKQLREYMDAYQSPRRLGMDSTIHPRTDKQSHDSGKSYF